MKKRSGLVLWVAIPGLVLSVLISALFLSEWYSIGVVADPNTIAKYGFGSEAMVGNGGWYYASAALYAKTALIEGICAFALVLTFAVAAMMRSAGVVVGAYILFVVGVVANWVFMR